MSEGAGSANALEIEALDDEMKRLASDKSDLICHLAFVRATLGNPNQRKLQDSFTGHIVNRFVRNSAKLAVLAICRIWDGKEPGPLRVSESLEKLVSQVESAELRQDPGLQTDRCRFTGLSPSITEISRQCKEIISSQEYAEVRVFRTEHLSHSLKGRSRDRKLFCLSSVEAAPAYQIVVSLAEETIRVIDRLETHLQFSGGDSVSSLEIEEKLARRFWDVLPQLSEVESTAFLSE